MINEKDLENYLITSWVAIINPGFVARLCNEFGLDFERIREAWRMR